MKGMNTMAFDATTQYANRYGLLLKLYKYGETVSADSLVAEIDFANEVSVDLSGETVWATGGQSHANQVSFDDPLEGTLTISTQMLSTQLLHVIAGSATLTGNSVTFNNSNTNQFYIIKGFTVWKDKDGKVYSEAITAHKASPQRAYNCTYTGTGDPSSMDIVFNLTEDDSGDVFTTAKTADDGDMGKSGTETTTTGG